ncbi:type I restriction endonuclease subunit R [Methylobacterium sp. EM32]|uniref:type I restriction endonuclease subunit R n=1 Tax=Methylobacterium sp. EM32 TaxID=3163481 RepID=UPI0033A27C33
MNETDVREVIVRPFIERLGYKYGTEAHIRTEVTLRYAKAYLGRKNPSKDPALQGRADYICEVIPYGRWVVEVKAPSVDLSLDDSEQAHTYATHPEIAALYYLLTNGREWRLYRVGRPSTPIFTWENEQTDNMLVALQNTLGPEAFKKRAAALEVDSGKHLALGLGSKSLIKGGYITYSTTKTNNHMFNAHLAQFDGMRAPITSGEVYRNERGEIEAKIAMLSGFAAGDAMMKDSIAEALTFLSKEEYISRDREIPTIFTNLSHMFYRAGSHVPAMFGNPGGSLPITISMAAFTHAVGYVDDQKFRGTFEIAFLIEVEPIARPNFQQQAMASMFRNLTLTSVGDFELHIT